MPSPLSHPATSNSPATPEASSHLWSTWPEGLAARLAETHTLPGALVLLPFCDSARPITELYRAGCKILAANTDPLPLLAAEAKLTAIDRDTLAETFIHLSDGLKGGQPLRQRLQALYQTADALAHLDLYLALGEVASQHNYVRPVLSEGDVIHIVDGRHPVVEQTILTQDAISRQNIQDQGPFIPNDTLLSKDDLIWIITGPNMSGKSTLLRQVALIVLIAQIGSFVPASKAEIGLVDRIFTRIGAQDEIHAGQSTFMVEMVETAALLSQSTPKSLLILDEIGRGTSTYDGLAIARSVVEYIHNNPNLRAKTLFATHYHELVELEKYLPHIKNYNVSVADEGGNVVFLHKIVPGAADRSYGVHVAQLAGIPKPVINRANEILAELENNTVFQDEKQKIRQAFSGHQLSFLGPETHPVVEDLKSLKIEELSPLEALNKLFELQQQAREEV